jgi:hypothetical protein
LRLKKAIPEDGFFVARVAPKAAHQVHAAGRRHARFNARERFLRERRLPSLLELEAPLSFII